MKMKHPALTPEQKQQHQIRWYVHSGGELIPRESTMRGQWGFEAKCSCGWETKSGGGVESWIDRMIWNHKFDVTIGLA